MRKWNTVLYTRPLRLLFLTLFVPLICAGTSVVRLSLEDAVTRAEWIVDGDVIRNWCGWDSGHRFIWTHTEIAVRRQWMGSVSATVTISEPGGMVGGRGMAVAGMVRYAPGEHVVVFLYRTPIGLIRTVGLAQGKLQVDRRGLVHPSASDAALVTAAGSPPSGTSIATLEAHTLSTVHDQVMRIANASRAVRK
jgi:hypothetical protein